MVHPFHAAHFIISILLPLVGLLLLLFLNKKKKRKKKKKKKWKKRRISNFSGQLTFPKRFFLFLDR
jgi:hypothetical protein